jgi:ribosomal-protein-alanine N-acetyltransferase
MRTVVTPDFTLEPQLADHAGEMFALLADPALYAFENEPPPSVDWLRERFTRLESKRSPDGSQQWLNWVIRLPTSELAGYVQATVHADGRAAIAYVLGSAYWGRGLASKSVQAMLDELTKHHDVLRFSAVFKRENQRSQRLLERLGFQFASPQDAALWDVEAGEWVMERAGAPPK